LPADPRTRGRGAGLSSAALAKDRMVTRAMETEKPEPVVRVVDRRWWARGGEAVEAEPGDVRKPTYVEELVQRLAGLVEQLQAVTSEHRRALEEFEQVKVRVRREVAREVERGRRAVIVEMLEVLDNLDRALAAVHENAPGATVEANDNLVRGIELVRAQFLSKLEGFGIRRISALGEPFDASRHEAVSTVPVEPSRDGIVTAVAREGYLLGDELLRPASVVVGRSAH
jgi:molecular chaperone GrpE